MRTFLGSTILPPKCRFNALFGAKSEGLSRNVRKLEWSDLNPATKSVRKFSPFKIDHHQTPQAQVKENQIYAVPFITNAQTFLSDHKTEVTTEFEKRILKVRNKSFLKFAVRVFVFQTHELQNIGIFHLLFRGNVVLGFRHRAAFNIVGSFFEKVVCS